MTTAPDVPYVVHEGIMARQERTIKRLWILCIIIFLAFVGSNLAWISYENSFEDVVETTTTDNVDAYSDSGDAIGIAGDDNEVTYGIEGESQEDIDNDTQ